MLGNYYKNLLIATLLLTTTSCQKVIDLDLNSKAPQIVIEGELSDQVGINYVHITKTVNFNETNDFPPVTGAVVTIADNAGNTHTLVESTPGMYILNTLQGMSGLNYILNVKAEGKEYQAVSSLPAFVPIQNLKVDSITFGTQTNKYVNIEIDDPAGVKNYYRVIEVINGKTLGVINIFDDEFQDGKKLIYPIFSDEDPKLKSGDNVELILQNIDKATYDYFYQLSEVINSGSQSTAPGNPTSNLSNKALGYFNAYSMDSKSIVIP